ncbi:MAG: M28 family metallopeptidase, partial [Bryobacteraceae bacterium]
VADDSGIRGFPSESWESERSWERKARAVPEPERIREYIRRISDEPHHAGSPASKAVAEYLARLLREWGYETSIEEFEALLPTPKFRQLEMTLPVKFRAKLQEPRLPQDKDSADANQLPTYNAYSASGDVTAPIVYVNYGMPADYAYLKKHGVEVKGKIVLARYGVGWRGVKPKVAAEHGAVGCLIYSDPREDGYFSGDVYPKGAFRSRDGVQRGSVLDMSIYPGDPLSPGWASEKGSRRLTLTEAKTLQKIPVLPISWADAQPLLENLGGPVAAEKWRGALPITYHVGPGPATVHLRVDFDWVTRPLYNVIARISGSEHPDQWVIYGNHHDAWVNGAADPASGVAALLETARSLSELRKQGWRPKRGVVFALWDGEEFGLIGSTEWVEKHSAELDRKVVAYLNSDMNGKGKLSAQGSPTLQGFLGEVLRDINGPNGKRLLKDDFLVAPIGSGSDYAPFIHHLGIASLNLGFSDNETRGVYHSIYDSFDWYKRFSDTTFEHGRALSQVMATCLLRLSGAPVVPFQFTGLAGAIGDYLGEIKKLEGAARLPVERLRKELALLKKQAQGCETRYRNAQKKAASADREKLSAASEALFRSERKMLLAAGLPGRDWFKHMIYAPGLYTGYGAKTLPGVREAAEAGQWEIAKEQLEVLAGVIREVRLQIQQADKALGGL